MLQPKWVRWGLIGCLLCGNLPTLRLLADSQQEAADILNVSRPYLIKLLDERKLPHRRVGNRRKVLLEDVLRFKRRDDQTRLGVLDELTREAQALGLEY